MTYSSFDTLIDLEELEPAPELTVVSDDTAESNFLGGGYDKMVIESVWELAETISGNDSALWRKDEFGAWINRLDYGKRHSQFGWEICDLNTGRAGGGIAALRPMQWQNYLDQVAAMTQTRITADGLRNIRKFL